MIYHVEAAKRQIKCMGCPLKIIKGGIKISLDAKRRRFYHATCFFKFCESDAAVNIPDVNVFFGLQDLEPDQIQQINNLVSEFNRQKAIRNAQGAKTQPNPTPLQPTTTVIQQAASSQSIPAQSASAIITQQASAQSPQVNAQDVGTPPGGSSQQPSSSTSPTPGSDIVIPFTTGIKVSAGNLFMITGTQGNNPDATKAVTNTVNRNMGNIPSFTTAPIVISSSDDDEGTGCGGSTPSTSRKGSFNPATNTSTPIRSDAPPPKRQRTENSTEDENVCSICLDPPVHAVSLPCKHVYCYLCAKGLVLSDDDTEPLCSLCRQPFNSSHLESSQVLQEASTSLNNSTLPVNVDQEDDGRWQWFYQGNKGWWRFERRNNEDIEKSYLQGEQSTQLLIVGKLYTIDFVRMEQYQSNFPQRKRHIKRDLRTSQCKGVAGLVKSTKRNNPN
eukprot:TRINITY_DN1667_c0_g1_i1.p1 TRINITY_DN1667_c0_g1~~TRINITY_DN1667_c0_g1_i1.p1  ORF type:complete len:444 (-),score=73.23 TRINITY_DN1667_c0_g1_i1:454-1785(-)